MIKTLKKILCSLLVLVMCLTAAPLQGFVDFDWSWLDFNMKASAANELAATGQCGENVFWDYDSASGKLVISGKGPMYDYSYTGNLSPFHGSNIKSVIINDGITNIGNLMFGYCQKLLTVIIPNSVTNIGEYAFWWCNKLTNVTNSSRITSIGDYSFYSCTELENIPIPDSVTSIGSNAFGNCDNIRNIIIPDSVTSIGESAFTSCANLTSITIPKSVTIIGSSAFGYCDSLVNINVDERNQYYSNDSFGVLYNKSKTELVQYPIGNSRSTYTIPDGVINIFVNAFSGCESIRNITIPNTVTNIADFAFNDCTNLTRLADNEENQYYSNDSFGVLYNKSRTELVQYPVGNSRSTYTIPNGVVAVHDGAFSFALNYLTEVIIPNTVTYIGKETFRNCLRLTNMTIPNSVTVIEPWTFYYCPNLKSVNIGSNITKIAHMAFGYCEGLTDVYYSGTEEQWKKISIDSGNEYLLNATIHYNYKLPQTSYFKVSSDQYSVDSLNRRETATYKINLLDENSDFLPVDDVTVQNNTTDIVSISTKKVSDTELELIVEPLKDGDASISLFNGDNSVEQFFNFTVYSNTTTYRADQVPVTNEKLKTNFSRGDMTVDNFEYYFDENKGKYVATMDVYNRSGAIGVVAAYTQDGKISAIEQVDPYIPLPGDFGEFLVYLGTGAVSIAKGENWNYRYSGYCQKTSIEIEVPEDGYLTVSCDVTSDNAAFIYNLVSIGVDFAFKTAEVIDVLGTDTDKLAKDTTKTLAKKVSEYFNEDSEWTKGAIKKLAKKLSKQFNMAYLEEISVLSLEMLDEMYKNVGEDFSDAVLDVILDLTKEEIKEFGVMAAAKKLVKDKVIGTAEKTLLKVASIMFDGGSYVNLVNSILGAYRYNVGTGKTMVVFKPKGEDGFICKDTIKVKSDIITDEVLLHTYIIKDTQKEDAFVRKTIYSDFNRGDGLRKEELSIDLNRIIEIHEISLWKNGQEIFDTFTATVEMNLPSYIDRRTCSIYRVEKEGSEIVYKKLPTRIEGNKIIFETNHFSEYILTGVVEDLQETTPCDVHVYDEVRTEPSCTEEGSITYTCYCGDTYTETIGANGHTDSEWVVDKDSTCSAEGSKHIECTVCEEVLKTEKIAKLPHNYSSVIKEATCETGGFTTYTCTCGDTYVGDKTPAKGHTFNGSVCTACGYDKAEECDCNCHASGIKKFFFNFILFFQKLFKKNQICEGCGAYHY